LCQRPADPKARKRPVCGRYRCQIKLRALTATAVLAATGCGAGGTAHSPSQLATIPQVHPHAVEPVAGVSGGSGGPPIARSGGVITRDPHLTGPASKTGRVAVGAPSDAQIHAAYARFQIAVAEYHLDRLNFSGVLLDPAQLPPGVWNVSVASVFTDYNKPVACGGVLAVPELGVANKELPCGTMVTFLYGGRAIRVPVIDRGPYIAGREWDLTGATAEALRFPGLGLIQWRIG
jgi:hypothetical protein